jgi:hypothetical protein
MIRNLFRAAFDALSIPSPSREFAKLGAAHVDGLTQGISAPHVEVVPLPWFAARWPGYTWPSRELARAARLERRKARRAEADNRRTSLDSVERWTF